MSRCVHVECQIGAYGCGCGCGGKANEELYQAIDRQIDIRTDGHKDCYLLIMDMISFNASSLLIAVYLGLILLLLLSGGVVIVGVHGSSTVVCCRSSLSGSEVH